jgi:hypothetical protein
MCMYIPTGITSLVSVTSLSTRWRLNTSRLSSENTVHVSNSHVFIFLDSRQPYNVLYTAATKVGAIVAGQTSVKAPEKEAFEKYLPDDVSIVSLHSLHGPSVDPAGQALVS